MRSALVVLLALGLFTATACASFGAFLVATGKALAPESSGGDGGADAAGGLIGGPLGGAVKVVGGALGMAALAIGRRMQRRGQALDVVTEAMRDVPDAARRVVTGRIKSKARRRGLNDVIEERIQG